MANLHKYKKLFATLFWVCILSIIVFSIIPNGPKMEATMGDKSLRIDYALHLMAYFSLSFLFFLWKSDQDFRIRKRLLIFFLIGSLCLSLFTELAQSIIPHRSFNPVDLLFNVTGILIGAILPKILFRRSY